MNAHFLFKTNAAQGVAFTRFSIRIKKEFRHQEQRDALGACRGVLQARQHEMDDILSHIVIAPGDVDFLARDRETAIFIRLSFGFERADIAACLRLGQVHRAGPFAGDEFGKIGRTLRIRAVRQQGFDSPEAQHWAKPERHVCAMEHFHHSQCQRLGQALPAPLFRRRQAHPATFHKSLVSVPKSRRRNNARTCQHGPMCIAHRVQWRQHIARQLGGFLQNGPDQFGIICFMTRHALQPLNPRKSGQGKLNIADRGVVGHVHPFLFPNK